MLIAVNPFKALQIYGPDAVDFYRGVGDKADPADEIDAPEHDDRATRCTTAKLPSDILEDRRRSLQVSIEPNGTSMFMNCKVHGEEDWEMWGRVGWGVGGRVEVLSFIYKLWRVGRV